MAKATKKEETTAAATAEETIETIENAIPREALVAAAEDINAALGIDPAIDTELEDDALLDSIKAEAKQIGFNPKTNKLDPKVLAEDQKALSAETWTLLTENDALAHLAELDKPAEKPADKKADKPAADKPKGEKAAPFQKRYSRIEAIADAIKAGKPTVEGVEEFYVAHEGKANPEQAAADLKWVIRLVAAAGGTITVTKDGILGVS